MPTPGRGLLQAGDVLLYSNRRFRVLSRQKSASGMEAAGARDESGRRKCPFYTVTLEPMSTGPLPHYMLRHHVKGDPPRTFRLPEAHFFVFVKAGGWRLTRKTG